MKFEFEQCPGTDLARPVIYQWTIEGEGVYVGKSINMKRRLRRYRWNVARLLKDFEYRPGNPAAFRKVHRALASASRNGTKITLTILENPPVAELNRREYELIQLYGTLNG